MDHVDDKGVALPAPPRIAHDPRNRAIRMLAIEPNVPRRMDVLVQDGDLVRRLHDLERVRHVVDARRADHEAFRLGIGGLPVAVIHLAPGKCQRKIGNLVAFDDALPRRDTEFSGMVLEIPDSSIHRLPDALEIRLSIDRARRAVRRRASRRLSERDWRGRHPGRRCHEQHRPHYCPPPIGEPANKVRPSGSLTSVALIRSD